MRVLDTITAQRLNVDEAYERFFDGFFNLGRPSEIFQATMVLSPPKLGLVKTRRQAGTRRSGMTQRARSRRAGRK